LERHPQHTGDVIVEQERLSTILVIVQLGDAVDEPFEPFKKAVADIVRFLGKERWPGRSWEAFSRLDFLRR
jgi:hypothetical protein